MIRINRYSLLIIAAVLFVLIMIGLIIWFFSGSKLEKAFSFFGFKSPMSSESIASQSVGYLNENILSAEGRTATLISFSEENDLVKMNIEIDGQNYDSYATRNGKLFFPAAIEINLGETQ